MSDAIEFLFLSEQVAEIAALDDSITHMRNRLVSLGRSVEQMATLDPLMEAADLQMVELQRVLLAYKRGVHLQLSGAEASAVRRLGATDG